MNYSNFIFISTFLVVCCTSFVSSIGPTPLALTPPVAFTGQCGTSTSPSVTGIATYTGTGCNLRVQLNFTDTIPSANTCNRFFFRYWTVTDGCGGSSSGSQTITLVDTTAPTIYLNPTTATVECGSSAAPSATLNAFANDTCSPYVTLSYLDSAVTPAGGCANTGSFTRTWTARDGCGNTATAVQTINIVDTTPPKMTIPGYHSFECPGPASLTAASLNENAIASDLCSTVTITSADTTTTPCGTGSKAQVISRTWTATDGCSKVSKFTQTIQVIDTRPPVITPAQASATVECSATNFNAPPATATTATATDLCDTTAPTPASVDTLLRRQCGNAGIFNRVWTATDACGNAARVTHTINIVDTTAPVLTTPPAPAAIECSTSPTIILPGATGTATAVEACTPASVVISYQDTPITTGCVAQSLRPSVTRKWSAIDACGQVSTGVQTITIQDTTKPTVTAPPTLNLQCGVDSATYIPVRATATDTCFANVAITVSGTVDVKTRGVYTRTWTGTDGCTNAQTAAQTVNVVDTLAPVLTIPADVVVECGQSTAVAATGVAVATDACDPAPVVANTDSALVVRCGTTGYYLRTFTATDAAGNVATKTQRITVADNKAPVITPPPETTIECTSSTAPGTTGTPTVVDACAGTITPTFTDRVVATGCGGTKDIRRTWYATDACGRTSSASQIIHIKSSVVPTVTKPADKSVECGQSTAPTAAAAGIATATSPCNAIVNITSIDTITQTCGFAKSISRAWYAVDNCGLRGSGGNQIITYGDNTNPVISASPAIVTVTSCTSPITTAALGISVVANDTCSSRVLITESDSVVIAAANCFNKTVTRTYTATDACGKTNTATVKIYVFDTTPPVVSDTARASVILSCEQDTTTSGPAGTVAFNDACSPNAINVVSADTTAALPGAPTCTKNQVITRTWTATDACGNVARFVQTIRVQDTTPPKFTSFPADETIECGTGSLSTTLPTASDNCDAAPVVVAANSFNTTLCGTTFVKYTNYTAKDACGNIISRIRRQQIVDTRPPSISATPQTVACTTNWQNSTVLGGFSVTDSCDPAPKVVVSDRTISQCGGNRIVERRFTATDVCGLVSSTTQRITVNTVADSFTAPMDATVTCGVNITIGAPGIGALNWNNPCSIQANIALNVSNALPICGVGSFTRTWTLTDNCNLPKSVTQRITVNAPLLTFPNQTFTTTCPTNGVVDPLIGGTPIIPATCAANGISNMTFVDAPATCGIGQFARTWTASYNGCYTTTAIQLITISGSVSFTAPPSPVIVECATGVVPVPTYSHPCNNPTLYTPTITFADTAVVTGCGGTSNFTRTWTAAVNGCSPQTATAQIRIVDRTGPVFTGNTAVTVQCGAALTGFAPTIVDACTPMTPPSSFVIDTPSATLLAGTTCPTTITRTYRAVDACGNPSTFTQVITYTV